VQKGITAIGAEVLRRHGLAASLTSGAPRVGLAHGGVWSYRNKRRKNLEEQSVTIGSIGR
jgi:hypothetical protein